MKQAIQELLQNNGGNYILPFFWQHGEDEAVLRDYMRAIYESNIRAVCVEARPHPDYAGPQWWHDMDIILDEARTRGMKVWILDDAHFPTGYANGAVKDAPPEKCKQYLAVKRTDVCGPLPQARLDVAGAVKYQKPLFSMPSLFSQGYTAREFDDDSLYALLAAPLLEGDTISEDIIDLTGQVENGQLCWDVPGGMWRVFLVVKTRNGGGRTDYINMLDGESCQLQIDAVYEPHWQRYQADFGKTIAGFFSDEPAVGNTIGFDFNESIGRRVMPLPWCDEMPGLMAQRLGGGWQRLLPGLWGPVEGDALAGRVRYAYMDSATRLIQKNFSQRLGGWCEAHGVEYIGHVVEDANQHARLGSSLGHFFRSMAGQHMAGIDDIGGQVLEGGGHTSRMRGGLGPDGDGEFFHFALGKLGASHAHIDPKKKGRAMCEIFGAYGWSEGVRQMKYLTDHFLVRGINHYVPHAFSPKEFPDPDCPPHFYAHGLNPQYGRFGLLMAYMNRVCHLFQNGTHVAAAGLLYHGEAEWAGDYMTLQKPARAMLEAQLDFDILPCDVFSDMDAFNARFADNTLWVNGVALGALVVPYAQFLPLAVLQFAADAAQKGFPVIFVESLPEGASDSTDTASAEALLDTLARKCMLVALEELPGALRAAGLTDAELSHAFADLRVFHYRRGGQDCYMLNNESTAETFEGTVRLAAQGPVAAYDAMDNKLYAIESRAEEGGCVLALKLRPCESRILVFGGYDAQPAPWLDAKAESQPLAEGWTVAACENQAYPAFGTATALDTLADVGGLYPDFSGHLRYQTAFTPRRTDGRVLLRLEDAYEAPEVWLNGERVGVRLAPPYEFDLTGLLREGENSLRIELATTLYRKLKAEGKVFSFFSPGLALDAPIGIIGDVSLSYAL